MTLPRPEKRSTKDLQEEVKRLTDTYKKCEQILRPHISQAGIDALNRINDAIDTLQREIAKR